MVQGRSAGLSINPEEPQGQESGYHFTLQDSRIVDEAWIRFNGYEVGLDNLDQVWMLVSVLDEGAIINCRLNPYGRQFPTVIGGLYHDSHKTYAQSLYDLMLPLHEISTWLLRSRVDNVQAALNNLIFVDPTPSLCQTSLTEIRGGLSVLPGTKPGGWCIYRRNP